MDTIKNLKIALVCNLKKDTQTDCEAEFDEPKTIEAIINAFKIGGFKTVVIEADDNFIENLKKQKPDFVFNIAEGKIGRNREATIPAILEYLNIPYSGSDVATLSLALDKSLTKTVVNAFGVKIPQSFVAKLNDYSLPKKISFPVIVKPNAEGSSKGISDNCVVNSKEELLSLLKKDFAEYNCDFLVEQYVDGREFTVGMVGNGDEMHVFEPMEVVFSKMHGNYKVYSFEVKRNYLDYISYKCPSDIDKKTNDKIKKFAKIVFSSLSCRDFARADFRVSHEGIPYFIEANPLPGLAPSYSDYPMLAGYNGVSYNEIVLKVLKCALKRYKLIGDNYGD